MVTVHREGGFRIAIYTDDHEPAHVHVLGDGEMDGSQGGPHDLAGQGRGGAGEWGQGWQAAEDWLSARAIISGTSPSERISRSAVAQALRQRRRQCEP